MPQKSRHTYTHKSKNTHLHTHIQKPKPTPTHPPTHKPTHTHTHLYTKDTTASPVFTSTRSGKGITGSKWMSSLGTTSPSSPSSPPPPFPNSCCPAPAQWNGFPESVNNKGGSVSVSTPTEYIHKHTDIGYGRGDACRIMSRCMYLYPVATELVTWQCQCVSTDRICPQAHRHKIQQKRCLQNNVTVHVPSHSRYCQAWDIKSNLSREAVQARIIQSLSSVSRAETYHLCPSTLSPESRYCNSKSVYILSSLSRYRNSESLYSVFSERYHNSESVYISVFSEQIL